MEIFKLFGSIFVDSDEAQSSISKTETKTESLTSKLSSGITTIGKWGAAFTAAAAVGVAALLKLEESTEEYRENMALLNTAFESNNMNVETAKDTYDEFYKILGDGDQATEAAQLLATLAETEEDLVDWTNIAAGVYGTFGDSLPIEGLIEAANETAKVGTVTGSLADALNWVGISEDEVNEKLAACSTEAERNALITELLTATYSEATDAFYENSAAIIETRENELLLEETTGKLGEAVSSVKNKLISDFLPAIADVASSFVDFIMGVEGADEALSVSIANMIDTVLEKLPEFLAFGIEIISAIAEGIIDNLPYLLSQLPGLISQIVVALANLAYLFLEAGKNLFLSLWEGMQSIWTSLENWVSEKVSWLVSKLAFWNNSTDEMSDGSFDDDPDGYHASGLNYVPYDGYKAVLHKGERVVNASDNSDLATQIVNGLSGVLEGFNNTSSTTLTVNLDSKEVAKVIYEPLQARAKQVGGAY